MANVRGIIGRSGIGMVGGGGGGSRVGSGGGGRGRRGGKIPKIDTKKFTLLLKKQKDLFLNKKITLDQFQSSMIKGRIKYLGFKE